MKDAITLYPKGENFAAHDATAEIVFPITKNIEAFENYLNDAVKLLDMMSDPKRYGCNPIGIGVMLGALAWLDSKGYYGKHNSHKPAKTIIADIMKEIKELKP